MLVCHTGQFVGRIQKVRGVEFSYQPPPRNIVPYAAALKGQHPRCVLFSRHAPCHTSFQSSTDRLQICAFMSLRVSPKMFYVLIGCNASEQ